MIIIIELKCKVCVNEQHFEHHQNPLSLNTNNSMHFDKMFCSAWHIDEKQNDFISFHNNPSL